MRDRSERLPRLFPITQNRERKTDLGALTPMKR
jgi:hypothetical protein